MVMVRMVMVMVRMVVVRRCRQRRSDAILELIDSHHKSRKSSSLFLSLHKMEQMLKQVVRQSEELYGVFRQLESESATRGENF